MLAAQRKGYVLAVVSALWLGVVLFVVGDNVILRETSFGGIARAMDALPSGIRSICFVASWAVLFLGWIVPGFAAIRLLRLSRQTNREKLPTTND